MFHTPSEQGCCIADQGRLTEIHDHRRGVMHFAPPREATFMHRRRNCIARDRDAEFPEEARLVDDLMPLPPNGPSLGTWVVRPVTATF